MIPLAYIREWRRVCPGRDGGSPSRESLERQKKKLKGYALPFITLKYALQQFNTRQSVILRLIGRKGNTKETGFFDVKKL